jgi:CubicO group peptidase (beta-lactamase class C family)
MLFFVSATYYIYTALPIISGYGAKNLCSCVFVSGRDPQEVVLNDISNGLLTLGKYTVDEEAKTATGSVFGVARVTAVFREDRGCTLLNDITETELFNQPFDRLLRQPTNPDKIPWPIGEILPDSFPPEINAEAVRKAVQQTFENPDYIYPEGTRGVVVVYDTVLIAEKYSEGFNAAMPQLGWSMTKSAVNAIIGRMVLDGKLSDVNNPPGFTLWEEKDDPRSGISVDDLLRMSSGLEWSEVYAGPSDATHMLFESYSAGGFAYQKPLESEPGRNWYYSSGTSNILSMMIHNSENDPATDIARKYLFNDLGMRSAIIEPDPSGQMVGSSFMWATPRDWARFGILFLKDGVFHGKRILPEGWVKYSTTLTEDSYGQYGAHFWKNEPDPRNGQKTLPDVPSDTFWAGGFQGQRVFIIPSKKLVVVRLGLDPEENFDFNRFLKDIIDSVKKPTS